MNGMNQEKMDVMGGFTVYPKQRPEVKISDPNVENGRGIG